MELLYQLLLQPGLLIFFHQLVVDVQRSKIGEANITFGAVKHKAQINFAEREFVEMSLSQTISLHCLKCITEHESKAKHRKGGESVGNQLQTARDDHFIGGHRRAELGGACG